MSELEKASATGNQSDYVRRLHQQIVQKDSIIKLLQVQVKNLEASGADAAALDRLTTALGEAEARLAEYEAREEADAGLHRKVMAQEAELESLRPAAERTRRVEAALALKDAEIERQRDMLRRAEVEDAKVGRLESDNQRLRRELDEVSRELGRLREGSARGGKGSSGASGAEAAELARLRERVADLEASLEVARAMAGSGGGEAGASGQVPGIDREDLKLLQEVIEASQVLEDVPREGRDPREVMEQVGEALAALRAQLGLERIATVGEKFDPDRHVVGTLHYSEEAPHDTVLVEEAAGYRIGTRVVKPAEVTVARNPWFCERCQVTAVSGATFCHHCGTRISNRAKDLGPLPDAVQGDRVRTALEAAAAARSRGDLTAARGPLEAALAESPDEPRLLEALVQIDESEGRFADALARLERKSGARRDRRDLERVRERLRAKQDILERLRTLR